MTDKRAIDPYDLAVESMSDTPDADPYDAIVNQLDDAPPEGEDYDAMQARWAKAAPYEEFRAKVEVEMPEADMFRMDVDGSLEKQLRLTQMLARNMDPARQAKAIAVARAKRIPVDAAYQYLDEFDQKRALSFKEIAKDGPLTARLAADGIKGPVVMGDEPNLAGMERGLTGLGGKPETQGPSGLARFVDDFGGFTPTGMMWRLGQWLQDPKSPGNLWDRYKGEGWSQGEMQDLTDTHHRRVVEETLERDQAISERDQVRLVQESLQKWRESVDPNFVYAGENRMRGLGELDVAATEANIEAKTDNLVEAIQSRPQYRELVDNVNTAIITVLGPLAAGAAGFSQFKDMVDRGLDSIRGNMPVTGALLNALPTTLLENLTTAGVKYDEKGQSQATQALMDFSAELKNVFPTDKIRQEDWDNTIIQGILGVATFVLVGAATGGAGVGTFGVLSEAGSAAQRASENPKATQLDQDIMAGLGGISGLMELIPFENLKSIFNKAGGQGFASKVMDVITQGFFEGTTEVAQGVGPDIYEKMTFNPKLDWLNNAKQSFLGGYIGGSFWGGLATLVDNGPKAAEDQQRLLAIAEAARVSNTVKIAPELVKEHIQQMKDAGAPDSVSAPVEDVQTLFQGEAWPEEAKPAFEELRRRVDEAIAAGTDVTIPLEIIPFVSLLKGFTAFSDAVRVGDGLSTREVKQLQEELQTFVKEFEPSAAPIENPIHAQVQEQLLKAGRAPEVAQAEAQVLTAFFDTMAERIKKPVEELWKRYGFSVTSTVAEPQKGETRIDQGPTYPVAPRDEWYGNANYAENGGRIVSMAPDDYLAKVRPLDIDESSRDNIEDLKNHIQSGRTLDPLTIYADGKEDGRHRAVAAKELGIQQVPVLVFGNPDIASPNILDQKTPEFANWFGDSKVVDAQGKPLVVYHHGGFNENEDIPNGAMHFGTQDAALQRAVGKRTDDALTAIEAYQTDDGKWHWDDGAGVTSEDVGETGYDSKDLAEAFGRTFVLDTLNDDGAEDGGTVTATYLSLKNPKRVTDQGTDWDATIAQAKAEGYDGIVYRNEYEDRGKDSYIAFSPAQIKSVNNRGTFDPENPNILMQEETPGQDIEAPPLAVETASLDTANTVAKSQEWATGRDLKMALQTAVQAALGDLKPAERSPEAIAYLTAAGIKDGLTALAQNPNAIGWYDVKTRQALAVMSLVHPEIAKDENARFAFTWALAVTSNGIKVGKNFELADAAYRRYKADGVMPTDIAAGKAQIPINNSMRLFNELVERWGIDQLRKFMLTEFQVAQIAAIDAAIKPSGEAADQIVRGAAIIGPKIGNGFFSNLYGKFDALTMDRWLVRTWGRWTGTLVEIDEPNVIKAQERLAAAIPKIDQSALATALAAVVKTTKKGGEVAIKPADRDRLIAALVSVDGTPESLATLAFAVNRASQEPKFRTAMNESPGGEELRLAGNSLAKYLDGQKEQPGGLTMSGPKERQYIREVFSLVLGEIRQDPRYADLTMADLQAVLWYAEKRLYETAKEDNYVDEAVANGDVSGYEDDEAPDYANAAAAQARADGVSDRRINAALKKETERDRTASARQGAAEETGIPAGTDTRGEAAVEAAARGFTRGEKRTFIQHRALDRYRSTVQRSGQPSRSYEGEGAGNGRGLRLLKTLGVEWVQKWTPSKALGTAFRANDIPAPPFYELQQNNPKNAARFVQAIEAARQSLGPIGEAVKVYSPEEYDGMRTFLSEDGTAGFALKPDGDIISVFSAKGSGSGRAAMETAVSAGGKKLDAFHTILPEYYAAHGFRGVSRLAWNDEIAKAEMPNWDKKVFAEFNNGEPDVVFMVYDPTYRGGYDPSQARLMTGKNDYTRAVNAQTRAGQAVDAARETVLTQPGTTTARGFISFNASKRDSFKVTLTEKANLSTFIHETGHFMLEVVQDLVDRGEADAAMTTDLKTLRDWMGLKDGEKIGTKEHEQFARGFEAYTMEGKAPSEALRAAFQKFKAWMIFVYKRLAGLNVKLSDDVRMVMDRLVASDAAIAEARTLVGRQGTPMSQKDSGLSDAEYATYVEAWTKAQDAQAQDADARVLLDAARQMKEDWTKEKKALTDQMTAEVQKTRGYTAWKMLTDGEGLAELRPGWSNIKIDPASVPVGWRGDVKGMTAPAIESGLPLDTVAEIMGFESGEEMLQSIGGAKMAIRAIPGKVRAQMAETHGEMTPAKLASEAMKAVHNKPTMEVLLTEYRALASAANIKVQGGTFAQIQNAAEEQVRGLTKRQLEPAKWRRAELRAAQKSAVAASKGDKMTAVLEKRKQLYAAAMLRASLDAQDRVEKIRDFLTAFTTTKRRQTLGKAGDVFLDGIDQILESIELKPVSLKTLEQRKTLAEVIEWAEASDLPVQITPEVLALSKRNYSQLTIEEMEGVHDAVKNLWTMAKNWDTVKRESKRVNLDASMDALDKVARENLGEIRKQDHRNRTWWDNLVNSTRDARAWLTKIEFLTTYLDGQPSGGIAHDLLFRPHAESRTAEVRKVKSVMGDLDAIYDTMTKDQKTRWTTKRQFLNLDHPILGEQIIMVALNLGTESSRDKLLRGFGWTYPQVMAELNTFMTKEDWDIVQKLLDVTNSLWPDIERISKLATGLPPEKLVAAPIQTPFGEYPGGYFPAAYDREESAVIDSTMAANAAKAEAGIFGDKNFLSAKVADGFTKKRTNFAAPMRLEMSVLTDHLLDVIHYTTHYEAVMQAMKIIRHPTFRKTIYETMGKEFHKKLEKWVRDIANNGKPKEDMSPQEKGLRWIRLGSTIANLGLNLKSAAVQQLGVASAIDAIGLKSWSYGIYQAYTSPNIVQNWQEAFAKSGELEVQIKDFDRDIRQIRDRHMLSMGKKGVRAFSQLTFIAMTYSQATVNVATWWGAYSEAKDKLKMTEANAINRADAIVRQTQSASGLKDLSPIQRGPEAAQLFTRYYSFFNVVFNRVQGIALKTRRIKDVPGSTVRLAKNLIVPSLFYVGFTTALGMLFGDDDDEEDTVMTFARDVALETGSMAIATVPGAQYLTGGSRGELSATTAQAELMTRAFTAIYKRGFEDNEITRSEAKAIAKTVSTIFKLPIYGVYKQIDAAFGDEMFE